MGGQGCRLSLACCLVAACCWFAAVAPAAEASVARTISPCSQCGGEKWVQYSADAGETNNVSLSYANGTYTITDSGASITPEGPDCQQGATIHEATCTWGNVVFVQISTFDGNDTATSSANPPPTPTGPTYLELHGGEGADTLTASAGNYSLQGEGGDDQLHSLGDGRALGGDGADHLYGGDGSSTLLGEAGNDALQGGAGAERLDGGDGNDTIDGGGGDDAIRGGAGSDVEQGGEGDDRFFCGFDTGSDSFSGGGGSDTLAYADEIALRQAPLTITLDGVADDGEAGEHDNVSNDIETIYGGPFNDTLVAGPGPHTLYGFTGDDYLAATSGANVLEGDDGNDVLIGGSDGDVLSGGQGDDAVDGSAGNDTLSGDGGYLSSPVDNGADTLRGGAGHDTFLADAKLALPGSGITPAPDSYDGGEGTDTVDYSAAVFGVSASPDGVADDGAPGEHDNILANVENVIGTQGRDTLTGNDGPNVIDGGGGDDHLDGGGGSDTIHGGDGNDVLSGGAGDDIVAGGAGDDTLVAEPGADTLSGEDGTDTADYSARTAPVTLSLDGSANDGAAREGDNIGVDVERLRGGSGADSMTGNEGANDLQGGSGNDRLSGAGGDDSLTGGNGDDQLAGATGDDQLDGGRGTNRLDGGPGDDRLQAGRGRDLVIGGSGDDSADPGGGADTLQMGSGQDLVTNLTDRAADRVDCGSDPDRISGSDLRDLLIGCESVDFGAVTVAAHVLKLSGHRVDVRIRCAKGVVKGCKGTIAGQAGTRASLLRTGRFLGTRAFRVKGGRAVSVPLALSAVPPGRRLTLVLYYDRRAPVGGFTTILQR